MTKEFKKLLIIISIILFFFYCFLLINHNGILLFFGDGADQYIQFVSNSYDMIRLGEFSMWNSTMGLGANMFTMFFTVLGSPSFYLMLLAPNKEYLVYFIAIIDVIRFLIISILAYLWISKLIINEKARITVSIVFTFSGWILFWMHMPHFMDMYIYLALILYCLEYIFEDKKKILFSLSIAGLGVLSIYQLYMMSWFILFYMLCRYFMKYGKFDKKTFLPLLRKTLLFYLLGIGMGMIVILPSIFILLSTNRIDSSGFNLFSVISLNDILRTITSMISPVSNDYDYNLYFGAISNGIGDGNTIYNYTTILFPLLLGQLIHIKFKGKKVLLISTVIMYSLLLFRFSYFIINGNLSIRWTFFFVVINCMLLAFVLENQNQWNKKTLIINAFIVISMILGLTILSRTIDLISIQNRLIQKYVIPFLILISCLYVVSLIKFKRLFYFVLIVEIIFCLFVRMFNGDHWIIDEGKSIDYYHSKIFYHDVIDEIKSKETANSFYRLEIDSRDNLGYNLPLANNYKGFSFYVSVYNYYTAPLYENRFGNQWYNGYQPSKYLLKSLLGNKYLIQSKDTEIPYGYHEINSSNESNYIKFENSIDMGLGYATNKLISYEDVKDKSIFEQDMAMLQGIIVDDANATSSYIMPDAVDFDSVNKVFKPLVDFEGQYYIDYSLDDPQTTCRYEMYYEGNQFDELTNYEVGYQAIVLDKPYNDVFAYCTSNNNPNHYSNINIYSIDNQDVDELYNNWNNQDKFEDVVYKDDEITAKIKITSSNKMVMTNIPYDPGWKVKIDGKYTPIKVVNFGLIGFELNEGMHDVQMTFIPQGLYVGGFITIVSLGILVFIVVKKK
ncbi:YfhO family protein [Anaerorhabdus furcosa]|uniref:Uncharacterized membrane protein YfhO n=1 Tax=Anaerorhabdus furcosa TaxID=118967 RepID=A0A1T4LSL0_9FIRM|nr:YfhO family protein [Anaerorhabdus furcosa]SJZ57621.1 Uncharacterized membrane protein YfhO [Anaerorhabdus furcosa]